METYQWPVTSWRANVCPACGKRCGSNPKECEERQKVELRKKLGALIWNG